MALNLNQLDRRRFLRGSGMALALPLLASGAPLSAALCTRPKESTNPKRFACIYFPDGVTAAAGADGTFWVFAP